MLHVRFAQQMKTEYLANIEEKENQNLTRLGEDLPQNQLAFHAESRSNLKCQFLQNWPVGY